MLLFHYVTLYCCLNVFKFKRLWPLAPIPCRTAGPSHWSVSGTSQDAVRIVRELSFTRHYLYGFNRQVLGNPYKQLERSELRCSTRDGARIEQLQRISGLSTWGGIRYTIILRGCWPWDEVQTQGGQQVCRTGWHQRGNTLVMQMRFSWKGFNGDMNDGSKHRQKKKSISISAVSCCHLIERMNHTDG